MEKPGKWLSRIGPGAIVASATVGAGETVLAVRAGAWAGYDLLWLILLAILAKSFLTLYLLGHYTVATGRAVAEKLVDLPGPRGWFLWAILVLESLVAPFVFVVIAVPCGRLMSQVLASGGLSISYKWLALAFLSMAILVGLAQRYDTLEKSQGLVCLVLLVGTVTATLLARPDFAGILKGLFSLGTVPPYPDWIPTEIKGRSRLLEVAAVFGYAGSIPMNYVVYSNWALMKGWSLKGVSGRSARKRALAPLKFDVGVNAVVVFLVTVAFMVGGAAILNPARRIPQGYDLLTEQAQIFAEISPLMIPLYYVTILAALWGTLNALPDIYGRGAHSFLRQLLPGARDWSLSSVRNVYGLSALVLSGFFIWSGTTPIIMVDMVALFSVNLGVGLTCIAAIWLNRQLPPDKRVPAWLSAAAVAGAAVTNVMALISAREVLLRYF